MDDDYEMPRRVSAKKDHHSQEGSGNRDEADLIRLGKKPVLKVFSSSYSLVDFS